MVRQLATTAQRKRAWERACVERVAAVRGGEWKAPTGNWPDGLLVELSGQELPVEVVSAYERPAGEDPKTGSAWMRAHNKAEALARDLERHSEYPVAFGARLDQPYAIPLDGQHLLPPQLEPWDPVPWIEA